MKKAAEGQGQETGAGPGKVPPAPRKAKTGMRTSYKVIILAFVAMIILGLVFAYG